MAFSPASPRLLRRILVVGKGEGAQSLMSTLGRLPGVGQVVQLAEAPAMNSGFWQGYDAVVEALGGVTPAFDVAMGALSNGVACFVTTPLLLAAHGRVLQAAALGQHTTLGWQGACFGAPVKEILTGGTPAAVEAAWSGSPNALLVRMGFRNETNAQARAQLRLTGADFSDMEGKHTLARLMGLTALAWPEWPVFSAVARTGMESVDVADIRHARHYGLQFVFGARVERVKGALVPYVGPLAVAAGHPLTAALAGQDVLLVQDEATGQTTQLTVPAGGPMAAGVVADMRSWLQRAAMAATQPLGEVSGWAYSAEDLRRFYVRGPYVARALLTEELGYTLLQEKIDAEGVWSAVLEKETTPLRPLLPEGTLMLPLSGDWSPEATAGLRLVA